MSPGTVIIVLLVIGWLLQLALAQHQARVFLRSVGELRATGTTAVGVGGKGWARARTYVALSAGPDGRVRQARRLRGMTVLARPADVPELHGRPLADLVDDPADDGTGQATAMAARTLLEAERGAGAARP